MGKINEYRRQQLASSAVGVASPDNSGAIIGDAVSKLGGTIAAQESKRADTLATIQANNSVIKLNLNLQSLGSQITKEMADNPDGGAERFLDTGQELISNMTDSIRDKAVKDKFLLSANVSLKAGVLEMGKWGQIKKEENAAIAAADTYRLGTINIGNTTTIEQLNQNLSTLKADLADDLLATSGPDAVNSFNTKYMPGAIESHLSNRVLHDPEQLIKDLNAGKYEEIEYFTDDMEKKFIKSAETRIRQDKVLLKQAQDNNFAEAMDLENQNQLTFNMVDALYTARNPEDGIRLKDANSLKRMLTNKAEANASALEKSSTSAAKYVDLIYKTMENREERAEVLSTLVDVYTDGVVTQEETTWLNKLEREKKTVQWDKKRVQILDSAKQISKMVNSVMSGKDVVNKEASYLRKLMSGVMLGADPAKIGFLVLNEIQRDKVVADNPALASYEDPVEKSYELEATNMLNMMGKEVNKKSLEGIIAQLKAIDNNSENK